MTIDYRSKIIFALSIFFVSAIVIVSTFRPYGWEFGHDGELEGWRGDNLDTVYIESGSVIVRGGGAVSLHSPLALAIPSSVGVLWLRAKVGEAARAKVFISSNPDKWFVSELLLEGEGYRDYKLDISGLSGDGGEINAIKIVFPQGLGGEEVSLDFLRLYEPTLLHYGGLMWRNFVEHGRDKGYNVNTVLNPPVGPFKFVSIIYFLVFAALVVGIFLREGPLTKELFVRTFIAAFFIGAVLLAARMDYGLLRLFNDDRALFSNKDVGERVSLVFSKRGKVFFDFVDLVKDTVPEGEDVRPASRDYFDMNALMMKYYLLPLKTSGNASYVWVYGDEGLNFDRSKASIMKGDDIFIDNVEQVAVSGKVGEVYKVLGEVGL